MFSINYLYKIRNNFAIISNSKNINTINKLKEIQKAETGLRIVLFVENQFVENDDIICIEKWDSLKHNFPKFKQID
jgi:hypothetical protein